MESLSAETRMEEVMSLVSEISELKPQKKPTHMKIWSTSTNHFQSNKTQCVIF